MSVRLRCVEHLSLLPPSTSHPVPLTPSSPHSTALCLLRAFQALIAAKAKLDAVDNNKNTALHYAAGYGQAESCKLLVERCACALTCVAYLWLSGDGS